MRHERSGIICPSTFMQTISENLQRHSQQRKTGIVISEQSTAMVKHVTLHCTCSPQHARRLRL